MVAALPEPQHNEFSRDACAVPVVKLRIFWNVLRTREWLHWMKKAV